MNLKFRNENEAMDKSGGVRRARRRRRRRRKQQHTIPDDSGPAESTNDQWKPIIKTGSVITTQSTNQLEIIGGNPSRRKPQTVGAGGGGGGGEDCSADLRPFAAPEASALLHPRRAGSEQSHQVKIENNDP